MLTLIVFQRVIYAYPYPHCGTCQRFAGCKFVFVLKAADFIFSFFTSVHSHHIKVKVREAERR